MTAGKGGEISLMEKEKECQGEKSATLRVGENRRCTEGAEVGSCD
jgi:hypothetical protein